PSSLLLYMHTDTDTHTSVLEIQGHFFSLHLIFRGIFGPCLSFSNTHTHTHTHTHTYVYVCFSKSLSKHVIRRATPIHEHDIKSIHSCAYTNTLPQNKGTEVN